MLCNCLFTVSVPEPIDAGLWVGVVGNTKELGEWNPQHCAVLTRRDSKWVGSVKLMDGSTIRYRYMIGETHYPDQMKLVNKWESHCLKELRGFVVPCQNEFINMEDNFGIINGIEKVENGWLSRQSEIRLTIGLPFFNAHQSIRDSLSRLNVKPVVHPKPMSMKINSITPLNFSQMTELPRSGISFPKDENLCVSIIIETYHPDATQVILKFIDPISNGIVGRSAITPDILSKSKGILSSPLLDMSGKALASIRLPYLIARPHETLSMSMEDCYLKHWDLGRCAHIGHRGSGNSYTADKLADIRENSIASFNRAAQNGADFVEFDVLLSKDLVPVVYHDFSTCVTAEKKDGTSSLVHVQVSDLNLDELKSLKMTHKSRQTSDRKLEFDEGDPCETTQPFPTLQELFEKVVPSTGFNVEVKWPTLDIEGNYEGGLPSTKDANEFVDIILSSVFKHAHDRRVIFSCFDVDICILLRRKQNKYPVLFLTNGDTEFYTPLMDLRERTNYMAIGTALSEGFIGLNSLVKDVFEFPETIEKCHEANLVFSCYGEDAGHNLKLMHGLFVDMVIYDCLSASDQLVSQE